MKNYQITTESLRIFKDTHDDLIDLCSTIDFINSYATRIATSLLDVEDTTTTTPTVSLVVLFFLLFLDVHNNVIGIGA